MRCNRVGSWPAALVEASASARRKARRGAGRRSRVWPCGRCFTRDCHRCQDRVARQIVGRRDCSICWTAPIQRRPLFPPSSTVNLRRWWPNRSPRPMKLPARWEMSSANAQPEYLAALTGHWRRWIEVCGGEAESIDFAWPLRHPAVERIAFGRIACRRGRSLATLADAKFPACTRCCRCWSRRLRQSAQLETDFDERLQTAKLDSLKEFAYGAGHELNNPLANIASRAQTLLREETHPDRRRRLAAINTQAFRAHEMLADMMLFARPPRYGAGSGRFGPTWPMKCWPNWRTTPQPRKQRLHPPLRRDPLDA